MDDSQLKLLIGAIITVGGGIGVAIRWSGSRIVKALDANSAALLKNAEESASLRTTMQFVYGVTSRVEERLIEENSGVHNAPNETEYAPTGNPPKRTTPGGGYSYTRGKTEGGDKR